MSQPYTFNLIFKGLFRCVPNHPKPGHMAILLVDARSPKSGEVTGESLRDHRAAIEFRLKDWRNRATEPLRNFVEVNKRNKDEVGIYLLDQEDIRIAVSSGELSPKLSFLEDSSRNSFLRIPQLKDISPSFAGVRASALDNRAENCIARLVLEHGLVTSERPSTFRGDELRWSFSIPRKRAVVEDLIRRDSSDHEKATLHQELMSSGQGFNLDIKVTMQVPADASVLIDPTPFPNLVRVDPPAFMLRPADGGTLDVWIKNRELEVILIESDTEGKEEGCLVGEPVDFDFELLYNLSPSGSPGDRRIPYRSDTLDNRSKVSIGGCACGGCA